MEISLNKDSKTFNVCSLPLVSIVVTTKNEEKKIENCLISIKLQSYKNIEIIVVDNFSTDKTLHIARMYANVVELKGPERSAQRNHGMIVIAKGVYVMYVDADMILSPNLVKNCVEVIRQNKNITALHIPEIILGTSYFSRVRRFERRFYDGTVIDGARFFDRKKFCDVGGFDEQLFKVGSGEDWDIDKKIKKIGVISLLKTAIQSKSQSNRWVLDKYICSSGVKHTDENAVIYHDESIFILSEYLKKKLYYSKGFKGYILKWGKNDSDIKRQFGFIYRYFIVFVEDGKWKLFIKNLHLAVGMYFLRVLVGGVYIYSIIRGR